MVLACQVQVMIHLALGLVYLTLGLAHLALVPDLALVQVDHGLEEVSGSGSGSGSGEIENSRRVAL